MDKSLFFVCILIAILSCGTFHQVEADQRPSRILVESTNNTGSSALDIRTQRVDPFDHLKKYRGGYNITNKHYWSSAVFTGKFGYIVAGIWILFGVLYGVVLLISRCCSRKREYKKRVQVNKHSLWPIIFGLLLAILAIVASGVVLGSSSKFHVRAKAVKNIIARAGNEASDTLHNVTNAVQSIQDSTQAYSSLSVSKHLVSTVRRLSDDADNIRRKTDKSMRILNKGIKILNILTVITVSVNLVVILALLASRPLKFRRIFRMLIIVSWILTFLFWSSFGLFYFLNKFAGDTCAALDEYKQDPSNSTLSSILPCNDQESAKRALREVGAGIHNIVDQVNANISTLQRTLSLTSVEYVCNPFSGPPDYTYRYDNCSSNTVKIRDIPSMLNTSGLGQLISAQDYDKAVVGINAVQMILDSYPGMKNLVGCGSVKDAFNKILSTECRPLRKYAHMSWAAFAALSTVMSALLLVSVAVARRDSAYRSLDGSVKPDGSDTVDTEM